MAGKVHAAEAVKSRGQAHGRAEGTEPSFPATCWQARAGAILKVGGGGEVGVGGGKAVTGSGRRGGQAGVGTAVCGAVGASFLCASAARGVECV